MSRYGLFRYGQGLYGLSSDPLYDATPIFAYSFPKSYRDDTDINLSPYLPSPYSPSAVDPDAEDYPDLTWDQTVGSTVIEPDLGTDFFYMLIRWTRPTGNWTDLSLVRRRYGPPETVDDGEVVLTIPSDTDRTEFVEILPQGESVFYGVFVRTLIGEWKSAGYTQALNCRNHDGLEEFFRAIPRVYTSATGGMLDVIDRRGQLSRFLQGLAFEYDYWKTQADSLSNDVGRLPGSAVSAWSQQLGMTPLDVATIGDRNLRRYLTSASSFWETKGTKDGIEALATAITGWPVEAEMSPNLMLDTDDSSAENSLGRWVATGGTLSRAQITGSVTSPIPDAVTQSSDEAAHLQGYVFTFATSGATASLSLGNDNPVNYGIPVVAGTGYKFNICWRSTVTTTGNLKADITWYDAQGKTLGTATGVNKASSGTWQQTTTTTGTAPTGAAYAGVRLSFSSISGSPVYHLDMAQFTTSSADVAGTFSDARSIYLNISPVRTNYCTNPSFETNTTGWSAGAQDVAGSGYVGSVTSRKAMTLTNTQIASGTTYSTSSGTFSAGDPLAVSAYVKATSGSGAASVTIPLKVVFKNASNVKVGTAVTVSTTVSTGSWQRLSLTSTACPADTSYVTITVAGTGTSSSLTGSGSSLLLDGVLIEKRDRVLSYFDAAVYGDTGSARWSGTAHASKSYLYPARLARQSALSRVMDTAVPAPCYVRTFLK